MLGGSAPAARVSNHTCPPKSTPRHPTVCRNQQEGVGELSGENESSKLSSLGINRWNLNDQSTDKGGVGQ